LKQFEIEVLLLMIRVVERIDLQKSIESVLGEVELDEPMVRRGENGRKFDLVVLVEGNLSFWKTCVDTLEMDAWYWERGKEEVWERWEREREIEGDRPQRRSRRRERAGFYLSSLPSSGTGAGIKKFAKKVLEGRKRETQGNSQRFEIAPPQLSHKEFPQTIGYLHSNKMKGKDYNTTSRIQSHFVSTLPSKGCFRNERVYQYFLSPCGIPLFPARLYSHPRIAQKLVQRLYA